MTELETLLIGILFFIIGLIAGQYIKIDLMFKKGE